jgi:uronate dehydrogenase
VHLAADATANQVWSRVIGPNIDAVAHLYAAAVRAGVRRVVYASSNHVMGGYQEVAEPHTITTDIPPLPGTHYVVEGEKRDSTPYGSAKLFGERLGHAHSVSHGLETVALRIGWVRPGENRAADVPRARGPWVRLMWLSNRYFCQLVERAIAAAIPSPFVVVNGMSANTGMRWDVAYTREVLGYEPQDDVESA